MIKIKRKIDMVSGNPPAIIHLKQYSDDVILEFELFASEGTFTVESGTTVKIRGTKPDGEGYSLDAVLSSATDSDTGTVTYFVTHNVDKQMTAAAGPCLFELTLMYGEKEVNTANFKLDIARAALDMDTPHSNSVLREFVNVNDDYAEIVSAAATALSAKDAAEEAAGTARSAAQSAVEAAESAGESAGTASTALRDVNDARDSALYLINEKAIQIQHMTTNAENNAADALNRVNGIENEYASTEERIEFLEQQLELMKADQARLVANGYVENEVAIFDNISGEQLFTITGIGGGSGGGSGGGTSSTMTMTNTSGWRSKTIAVGKSCPVTFNWTSLENEIATGPGVMQIYVGGSIRTSQEVQQGDVTVDVSPYLSTGSNSLTIRVTDIDGNYRSINYTITVSELSISSTFDSSAPFTGPFTFSYTPVGSVQKTVHFIVDGVEIGQTVTRVSGKQMSYMIPAQTHGAHSLRVYFDGLINNETVTSNELFYEFIYVESLNDDVIIASSFNQSTAQQYSTIQFSFTVLDPLNLTTEVDLYANDTFLTSLTVDRTEQAYAYRADTAGELNFRICAGAITKTLTVTVQETEIDVAAETENLVLYLNAIGRRNSEAHPEQWTFTSGAGNTVSAALTDFNWDSDGWGTDVDGNQRLRFKGAARGVIDLRPFANDPRPGGYTISIDFATRDVIDYTVPIISCMNDGKGFVITPESAELHSDQSKIGTPYKEDEHLRVDFVISKRANGRLLKVYTDGVQCGSAAYPDNDSFVQTTPAQISIGSSLCTVDIYGIRIYENDLTSDQLLDNWTADTQDGALMLERYTRNNIYDDSGKITISKLPSDLPYMIIRCEELPQYKGDKKTATLTFIDPVHPGRSFVAKVQLDVQGTSSQHYPRKNYKAKAKEGFTSISTGTTTSKYQMNDTAIPANTFTFKADFASSESANNTVMAMLYNDTNPYKTPAQEENELVRQAIQGFPMAVFWDDGSETTFVGKYNFNDDKSSEAVFGFVEGDECWELLNNTSNRVLGKSDDFESIIADESGNAMYAWLNDFEARYPDEDPAYVDGTQLHAFLSWLKSTDAEQATGNALDEPVTWPTIVTEYIQNIDPDTGEISYVEVKTASTVTFTEDTAEYRIAKFKNEAEKYIELESLHFDAVFKEFYIAMDNLAKNNMFAFVGDEVVTEEVTG